jgi:hypothetical protein
LEHDAQSNTPHRGNELAEIVAKVSEKRIQKANGTRRIIVGREGQRRAPLQIERIIVDWSTRSNDIRSPT